MKVAATIHSLVGKVFRSNPVSAQQRKPLEKKVKSGFDFQNPFLVYRDLPKVAKRKRGAYRDAEPFPHIVFDNFFDRVILKKVWREVRNMDRDTFHETESRNEIKLSIEDDSRLGPVTWKLIQSLNSGAFLSFLEVLTSTKGLITDPHLRGGGVHEIQRGGKLGIHTDFNYYERLKLYRRLNLLLYLNRGWSEEWGGHLELWNREGTRCCQRISPNFNRMVIFDTSNFSYHGHPEPLNCPAEQSRKSLALYYYTVDYPHESDLTPHSTRFVGLPSG